MTKHHFRIPKPALFAVLAVSALVLAPAAAHAGYDPDAPVVAAAASSIAALPDGQHRYIVQYGDEVDAEAESQSLKEKGITVKETLTHTMKASVVEATPEEAQALKGGEGVASVEPDTLVSISSSTDLWGLDRIDQRTGTDGQFNVTNEGAGVDVYVLDTGINTSHTDFSGRIVDQWWGVHDGRAVNDCNGHGTHVAGTAAGTTYGVAKRANIIPIRALACDGSGWTSTVIAGIEWAVARHVAGQPAVLNLSIGGFTTYSLDHSVQSAVHDGITVVAAAGNTGSDACHSSPARVPTAITVAATISNDHQVSWSNYGSCVDVQAPGVSIRSAWINAPTGYNTLSGTSMAAPHVAGAAAILLSRDRAMAPAQVHDAIINYSTPGVVHANKGATPNRMLFVPAPNQYAPSCANLQLGSAWAGVGTHCGLKGTAASTPEPVTPGPAEAGTDQQVSIFSSPDAPAPEVPPVDPVPAPAAAAPAEGRSAESSAPAAAVPAEGASVVEAAAPQSPSAEPRAEPAAFAPGPDSAVAPADREDVGGREASDAGGANHLPAWAVTAAAVLAGAAAGCAAWRSLARRRI